MDLEYWLTELRRRHWTLHLGGPDPRQPDWLAAHFAWPDCADVLILRDEHTATAYRTPAAPDTDLLAPDWVTWVYSHNPIWTLRAVLTLEPPGSPHEPCTLIPAPPACHIPAQGRRPVTIRPLTQS
ncbi:MAG TPA: hypothetical protein VFV67_14170 [Actinophytocola sp.]|uniref:hypothetical protein n=1 Tax=Actinophytocola sp. TaxID=1872138 RepID=UPI002DB78018|nr:hypothetical protein [Actinophytocola sp.]HEU5471792.1 hypothetical protein [Actinophytocola sp.]